MIKKQKGFVVQGIIAVIALLIITGGSYVISQKQKNNNSILNIKSENTNGVSKDAPLNFKTYANSRKGYEIVYPADWKVEENLGVSVRLVNPSRQGKADTDQPTERVTVLFDQVPCKESNWTVGFGNIYYSTVCVSADSGEMATINSVAFDEQGKNTEEKIVSSFKLISPLAPVPFSPTKPFLSSITPSSGKVGTPVTLQGNQLNGFEGDTYLYFIKENGESGSITASSYLPEGATTLKFTVPEKMCTKNMGESELPCLSFMIITPGTYRVYAFPWGDKTNELLFTVTSQR